MQYEVLSWNAKEHEHWERSKDWYWGVGITAVTFAVIAFIFGNFLFGVVILLGAGVLAMQAEAEPEDLFIEINPKGIQVNNIIHPYEDLASFWVEDDEFGKPILILKSEKLMMPYIILPIENISPMEVRNFLDQIMVEEKHHEPLYHKVMEFLGF